MHRDEGVRAHRLDELALLAAMGVAAHVDAFVHAPPEHVDAPALEGVDQLVDQDLVARDDARRVDHAVGGLEAEVRVGSLGEAGPRSPRLALRARGEHDQLGRVDVARLLGGDLDVREIVEVAVLLGQARVAVEAAAEQAQLAIGLAGGLHEGADAVHVRGEERHADPRGRLPDELAEVIGDGALVARSALGDRVGRVAEQEAHAFFVAHGAQPVEVEGLSVGRILVDLEVAAVHDRAGGGAQDEPGAVWDRVGHPVGLDLEGTDRDAVAGREAVHLDLEVLRLVVEALADQRQRVGRPVDGDREPALVEVLQQVVHRADVVLVPVGDHDGDQPLGRLHEIAEVGVQDVRAEPAAVERQATVDHDALALVLDGHAVHADLAEPAEGYETARRRRAHSRR